VAGNRADDWFVPRASGTQPAGIDPSVAHIARVCNYWRGGKDNSQRPGSASASGVPPPQGQRFPEGC
jgi:hypothetical protein